MEKCSLTIHGLKQHSASRMGQLTDFLCKEFELSEELIQARLQRFPVTFKNWVEPERIPALQSAFDRLETMVEFSTPNGAPVATAPPVAPSNELELPPDIAAALENSNLSWDDAAPPAAAPAQSQIATTSQVVTTASPASDPERQTTEPPAAPTLTNSELTLSFDEPAPAPETSLLDKLETMDLLGGDPEPSAAASASISPNTHEKTTTPDEVPTELDFSLAPDPLPQPAPPPVNNAVNPNAVNPTAVNPTAHPAVHPAIRAHDHIEAEPPTGKTTTDLPTSEEAATHQATRAETPEVLIAATTPTHPKQIDDFVPDDELHTGPSLLHLLLAIVVIGLTAGGYLVFGPTEQSASPILISNVDQLLAQQGEILNPTASTSSASPSLTKTREIPNDLARWTGESTAREIKTVSTAQVSSAKGLWDLELIIETPPPAKLTPAEIVNKTPERPWIYRIETSELTITVDAPDKSSTNQQQTSFQFQDTAKVYLRRGAKAERLTGALTGRGVFDRESHEILGEWSVKAGQTLPANSQKAQREPDGSISFSFSGPFVARAVPNAVNSAAK